MPTLSTVDGAPVEVITAEQRAEIDREFSRAMATDEPGGVQSPPRRDDKPADQPRRGRGRPRKNPDDKPRVTDKPVTAPAAAATADYTEACAGLSTLGWATLAAIPWTTPYAAVVEANQEQLVTALNAGCQQNPQIREAVERWSSGAGGVYMLQLAAVGTNMAVQTVQLLKDPALRAQATEHTRGKFRDFLAAQGVKVPEAEVNGNNVPNTEATDAPVAA